MTNETPIHHTINYIELSVADMSAAKEFYASAFGWQFNAYGPTYAGIRKGEGEVGGLALATEESTKCPLVILYSKDLDSSLKAVEDAGGTITKPPFSFPGGRRFHFMDPSGTELAVWSES